MTKSNGILRTILIIIAILVTLALAGVSAILNYGNQGYQVKDNSEDIAAMEPDIEKNNEHTHVFEEKVTNMDKKIDKILEKVEKL